MRERDLVSSLGKSDEGIPNPPTHNTNTNLPRTRNPRAIHVVAAGMQLSYRLVKGKEWEPKVKLRGGHPASSTSCTQFAWGAVSKRLHVKVNAYAAASVLSRLVVVPPGGEVP